MRWRCNCSFSLISKWDHPLPLETIYRAKVIPVILFVDRVNGPGYTSSLNILLILGVKRVSCGGHFWVIGRRWEVVV